MATALVPAWSGDWYSRLGLRAQPHDGYRGDEVRMVGVAMVTCVPVIGDSGKPGIRQPRAGQNSHT